MSPLTTCLCFDGSIDDAVTFYCSVFPNSSRADSSDYLDDMPKEKGEPLAINFELNGSKFMALNGPAFEITPAISFMISCVDQAEVDYYWDRLVDGGRPVQCGWLVDRFGISWQVVPQRLGELMSDPDPDRAGRVAQAMMKMVKLDVAALEAAAAAS